MTTTQEYINVTSVLIEKRGIYQIILNYYINGKRKQPWRSLGIEVKPGNKKKAERKQKEIERQFEEELNTPKQEDTISTEKINNNINVPVIAHADMLYGDYLLKVWLPFVKNSLEVTSYSGYENKVKITAKYFNNLKITLNNLTKADIKKFYSHLQATRHIKKFYSHLQATRHIKNKTVNRYHANVHKSLEDAITEFEILEINPAHGLRKKEEQHISTYYKQKDLEILFKAVKGNLIELHVLLASYYRLSS